MRSSCVRLSARAPGSRHASAPDGQRARECTRWHPWTRCEATATSSDARLAGRQGAGASGRTLKRMAVCALTSSLFRGPMNVYSPAEDRPISPARRDEPRDGTRLLRGKKMVVSPRPQLLCGRRPGRTTSCLHTNHKTSSARCTFPALHAMSRAYLPYLGSPSCNMNIDRV